MTLDTVWAALVSQAWIVLQGLKCLKQKKKLKRVNHSQSLGEVGGMVHDSKDHCSKHNCLQESRQQEKEVFKIFPFKKIHCRLFCIAFSSRESSKPLPFNCG